MIVATGGNAGIGTAPAHRSVDTQPGRFVDCSAVVSAAQSSAALYPGCARILKHKGGILTSCMHVRSFVDRKQRWQALRQQPVSHTE